jgi:hypothetical protein
MASAQQQTLYKTKRKQAEITGKACLDSLFTLPDDGS